MTDLQKALLDWMDGVAATGIFTTDVHLNILTWNQWMAAHSDFDRARAVGCNLLDLYPDLAHRGLDQFYHSVLAGAPQLISHRLHRYLLPMSPQEATPCRRMEQTARIDPLYSAGRVIGTVTVIEDVSQRVAREEELRRQLGMHEVLAEVDLAILTLSLEDCLRKVVEGTTRFTGAEICLIALKDEGGLKISACGSIGGSCSTVPDVLDETVVGRVIRSGRPHLSNDLKDSAPGEPVRPVHPDSRSLLAVPLTMDEDVIGVLLLESMRPNAFNEWDRRLMESLAAQTVIAIRNGRMHKALQESEGRYRTVTELSMVGIALMQDGRFRYANPAFARIFGYSVEEVLNDLRPMDVIAPEDRQLISEQLARRLSGEQEQANYRFRGLHKDGQTIHLEVFSRRVAYEGRPAVLATFLDVTREVQIQAQLNQAQKMEAMGTLAGGIAHDFNNILGVVLGYTELALFEAPKDSALHRNLDQVLKAGRRAKDLVKQILAFSRKGEQERQPLAIGLIVKEALKMLRASLPSTIEIKQHIAVSPGTGGGMVMADPTQIHQVLMNLCTNAAHAMEAKGGILEVSLTDADFEAEPLFRHHGLKPGPYLKLTVSDTGHGMDPATLERIFEPYFTTKAPGEGTGLGLAVVHGIVESHGGKIFVESTPGEGSRFHVILPSIQAAPSAAPEACESIPGGTERILFVDDEPALVKMWQTMLDRLGYQVTAFTSSLEALEAFRAEHDRFDLIVTDQTMPHLTGLDLAGECLRIRSGIPVILCTGYSKQVSPETARASGIRELLMKPLVPAQLAQAIRRALG